MSTQPTRPTPAEAARALDSVGRREDQALDSVRDSRWVHVVFGIVIFAFLAAPDFLGADASTWTSLGFTVLVVGYAVMLRTRRGAAMLGRPAKVRPAAVPRKFARYARLVILAVAAVGLVGLFVPHPDLGFSYWGTATGAVLGLLLIFFGRQLQNSLLHLARYSRDDRTGSLHGTR
ncbi:hypothetical protein QR77_13780 [Streptomyces sp. 150FB]|uniref:hypothetical protein n=1 Tax=Streptomyces sp. 150FB TaxID=1576605 RepID=UPI00058928BC|nr:hypothetical protein [Streptomyces sp. 150FB]KIF74756.1 hypothetical protein QR77_13780 [Streptomyces sp. 150FB]